MPEYPYEPPAPDFDDIILAYARFTAPTMLAVVEPDPLGPINNIVRLCRDHGTKRTIIKSALCPVPAGAHVAVEREPGAPLSRYWTSDFDLIPELTEPHRAPGWSITIDGRTVLTVTDADCRPPAPAYTPPPWRTRIKRETRRRAIAAADKIAARLGYQRSGEI